MAKLQCTFQKVIFLLGNIAQRFKGLYRGWNSHPFCGKRIDVKQNLAHIETVTGFEDLYETSGIFSH